MRHALIVVPVLLACGEPSSSEIASSSEGGSTQQSESSTGCESIAPDTGADGVCVEARDCGGGRLCRNGVCGGCGSSEDCPTSDRCWRTECWPVEHVPSCVQLEAPVCGNGVIEANEEIEDGIACHECRRTEEPEPWLVTEELSKLVAMPDGGALVFADDSSDAVARYGSDGSLLWSQSLGGGFDLAVDAEGNGYGVGVVTSPSLAYWMTSWSPDGEIRWSRELGDGSFRVIAADGTRVLVGGSASQLGTSSSRGVIAQYDRGGAMQWSVKHTAVLSIEHVTPVDADVAALGPSIDLTSSWRLVRLDPDGVLRWSTELSFSFGNPWGVVADGTGGTWTFGDRSDGPWLVQHDTSGQRIQQIDCLGNTAGVLMKVAVAPDGRLALGVYLTQQLPGYGAWIAIVDHGAVSTALAVDGARPNRVFALDWRDDGGLFVGLSDYSYSSVINHVLVLDL